VNYKLLIISGLFTALLTSCYEVNRETSEIGSMAPECLSEDAWKDAMKKYPTEKITDSVFLEGLKQVQNHFIKPDYILYFDQEPKEIIGCDWYSVRVAFNPKIFDFASVCGLSGELSDKEQIRIRNRVFKVLMEYQCEEGKAAMRKAMAEPAVFSEEYYDKN